MFYYFMNNENNKIINPENFGIFNIQLPRNVQLTGKNIRDLGTYITSHKNRNVLPYLVNKLGIVPTSATTLYRGTIMSKTNTSSNFHLQKRLNNEFSLPRSFTNSINTAKFFAQTQNANSEAVVLRLQIYPSNKIKVLNVEQFANILPENAKGLAYREREKLIDLKNYRLYVTQITRNVPRINTYNIVRRLKTQDNTVYYTIIDVIAKPKMASLNFSILPQKAKRKLYNILSVNNIASCRLASKQFKKGNAIETLYDLQPYVSIEISNLSNVPAILKQRANNNVIRNELLHNTGIGRLKQVLATGLSSIVPYNVGKYYVETFVLPALHEEFKGRSFFSKFKNALTMTKQPNYANVARMYTVYPALMTAIGCISTLRLIDYKIKQSSFNKTKLEFYKIKQHSLKRHINSIRNQHTELMSKIRKTF